MIPHIPRTTAVQPLGLLALAMTAILVGCDQKDPGVQAELIQLKSERSQLNSRVQELEASIQSKNDEINTLRTSASENSNFEYFDKKASMTSFIAKVAELKSEIQREFPDAQLSDSVQMPAFEAPLQSEVKIELRRSGQAAKSFLWIGRGKLTGEWEFSQRQEGATGGGNQVAQNTTGQQQGTGGTQATPPINQNGGTSGSGVTDGVVGKQDPAPPPAQPNDIPTGSRLVREDANGKVWLTPDGRYIIKLNQ